MTIASILTLEGVEPMSLTSVNKHISWLTSMLKYAVNEGYIASNPATGLQVARNTRADLERSKYTNDDINTIVRHLKKEVKHPEQYWIPVLDTDTP